MPKLVYAQNFQSPDRATPAEVRFQLRAFRFERLLALLRLLGPYVEDLIELVRGINLGELGPFLTALREFRAIEGDWSDPAALKARVLKAFDIAVAWTRLTPGDSDDELVDAARAWTTAHPDVLDLVIGLVAAALKRWSLSTDREAFEASVECQALFEVKPGALSIDWALVYQIARMIFDILVTLLPKQEAKAAA